MSSPLTVLAGLCEQALVGAFGPELAGVDPLLRRSDHADFQSNVALSLKKRVPGNPRELAAKIVQAVAAADAAADTGPVIASLDVAGPGFINIKLKEEALAAFAQARLEDPRLGVAPSARPERVVIDYSAPNIAKEMHVGHLRSTIIGDALARTLSFSGHEIIRQNHLGDWGTPFGMLIEHLIDLGEDASTLTVGDLSGFYKEARRKFDGDPAFAERSRKRVVTLQGGDADTLRLWKLLVDESKRYFQIVYDKLGVTLDDSHAAPESLYNDRLAPTLAELGEKGLTKLDQGALCVFPPGFVGREGEPAPLIARKQDGGYGYATTDLAAIRYRALELEATRIVYVIGAPQATHLAMIYKTAELAGWLENKRGAVRPEHVAFGSVLGADGKMLKSREGDAVKLIDLLNEADERALAMVIAKDEERVAARGEEPLSEEERRAVAHAVGMAAIKYADLSSDRIKDYVFDWKRMLATEGNTGPYLQYAHARVRSILRKAAASGLGPAAPAAIRVAAPAERNLVLSLLAFDGAVRDVEATLEPHRLCTYLYELAGNFSRFFVECPVLKAEPAERASRLALCELTARVLAKGLDLLGIAAPDRM